MLVHIVIESNENVFGRFSAHGSKARSRRRIGNGPCLEKRSHIARGPQKLDSIVHVHLVNESFVVLCSVVERRCISLGLGQHHELTNSVVLGQTCHHFGDILKAVRYRRHAHKNHHIGFWNLQTEIGQLVRVSGLAHFFSNGQNAFRDRVRLQDGEGPKDDHHYDIKTYGNPD